MGILASYERCLMTLNAVSSNLFLLHSITMSISTEYVGVKKVMTQYYYFLTWLKIGLKH